MRFGLFRELYIHHRSSCGPGPTEPCAGLRGSQWELGHQRLDPGLWPGGHCLAANGSGSDTSSGLSTELLCEHSAPHRCHSHTRVRLRTQILCERLAPHRCHTHSARHSFCMSAWHHTDVTHKTHTHSSQQCTLTFRHTHTHGSGHSFCVSAWHHTDTHTIHSSAHSHSGPLRSPGRWAMERHPLQHPRPMLSANPAAEPEPPEDAASG